MCNQEKATKIIALLQTFSGHAPNITEEGAQAQKEKIKTTLDMLGLNDSFRIVIPAFPFKSSNRDKVLGALPDLGEETALKTLSTITLKASEILDRPCVTTIYTDGFLFNDLFKIPEEQVHQYHAKLKSIANEITVCNIQIKCLGNYFPDLLITDQESKYRILRKKLMTDFGIAAESAVGLFKNDAHVINRVNQLQKFYMEEHPKSDSISWKFYNKERRNTAKETWLRGEAWSKAIAYDAKDSLRLTIHTHTDGSERWPVQMVNSQDRTFRSPWFNAPVQDDGGNVVLMPRAVAEEKGYSLIEKDKRPWAFQCDQLLVAC